MSVIAFFKLVIIKIYLREVGYVDVESIHSLQIIPLQYNTSKYPLGGHCLSQKYRVFQKQLRETLRKVCSQTSECCSIQILTARF
jgi:hypothetical protein